MKLNYNSFSSKLYRLIYATDEMPSNLCSYFWKVIASYVIAIPILIITLPFELLRIFIKDEDLFFTPIDLRIFITFIICCFLLGVFTLISPIILLFGYKPENGAFIFNFIYVGLFSWVIGLIFGLTYVTRYLQTAYKNRITRKKIVIEHKNNIVVEFVKTKYNKCCSKIDWEHKPKKNSSYINQSYDN
jgi:hypothetical protein